MGEHDERERAAQPEDLDRFFLERGNAGDVEGLAELYEAEAVLAFPPGQVTVGRRAIRQVYAQLLAGKPTFAGEPQPALCNGDLALTSTRLPGGGATVEVARRQPDGSWLWVIDQPNILG
jgi:ketosteroid isomerase-like protein